MIKIVIADDHEIFRKGLKVLINDAPGLEVVGDVANGADLIRLLELVTPDLIVMDISMPVMNGIEASERILQHKPRLPILILSMHDDVSYYNQLAEIGVKGFVLKDSNVQELITAIRYIAEGRTFFSQTLLMNVIKHNTSQTPGDCTPREYEVLQLIAKGYTTKEIADELHMGVKTAERHRANLLEKTGTDNSLKLLVHAIKHGWISLGE